MAMASVRKFDDWFSRYQASTDEDTVHMILENRLYEERVHTCFFAHELLWSLAVSRYEAYDWIISFLQHFSNVACRLWSCHYWHAEVHQN